MQKPSTSTVEHRNDYTSDERSLVQQLRQGDQSSYEILHARYGGPMLSVATGILRNHEDARDTLQDSLLKAFRSMHSFRGDSALGTWLHRIVVNMAITRLRVAKRRPESCLDEELRTDEMTPSTSENPESMLLRDEEAVAVRDCIGRLPESSKIVVLLRYINELNTAETAARLDITPTAVKMRLHKARRRLMKLIENDMPPGSPARPGAPRKHLSTGCCLNT